LRRLAGKTLGKHKSFYDIANNLLDLHKNVQFLKEITFTYVKVYIFKQFIVFGYRGFKRYY